MTDTVWLGLCIIVLTIALGVHAMAANTRTDRLQDRVEQLEARP